MPARLALFDVLEGRFGGGAPVSAVSQDAYRSHSIVGNLQRLLNARQGSAEHLPGYGLPDLATIHREAPDSFERLGRAIKLAVETYEPRLKRVFVERADGGMGRMRATFVVSGEIEPGRRVRFQTTFGSQEGADVREV
jgi:type VI secretion system protein